MNRAEKQMAMTEKCINLQMNLMSAIAIIMVVCGHEACGVLTLSNLFPYYSFHLPVFVFISGYFYSLKAEQNVLGYIIKNAKKLLGYLLIWQFIYAALLAVLNYFYKGMFKLTPEFTFKGVVLAPFTYGTTGVTLPLWYLVMIFFLLLFNVLVRKFFSWLKIHNEYIIFLIYLVLGLWGIIMARQWEGKYGIYLRMTQVFFFLPFFSAGRIYREKLENAMDRIPNRYYFGGVFLIQTLVMVFGGKFQAVSAWMTGFDLNPLIYYIYAFNGVGLLLRISRILVPAIGNNPAILYLGQNTRTVMAHHESTYFALRFLLFLLSPYCNILADFDVEKFTTTIAYHYYPGGKNGLSVIYVILTIIIPLFVKYFCQKRMIKWKYSLVREK